MRASRQIPPNVKIDESNEKTNEKIINYSRLHAARDRISSSDGLATPQIFSTASEFSFLATKINENHR
jgi:hypothetical protein